MPSLCRLILCDSATALCGGISFIKLGLLLVFRRLRYTAALLITKRSVGDSNKKALDRIILRLGSALIFSLHGQPT